MSRTQRQFTAGGFEASHEWTAVDYPALDPSRYPVIVGSITSFQGSDAAGLRFRNVESGGLDAFVEEETSGDAETWHKTESVRFLGARLGPITDASGDTIGEAGGLLSGNALQQPDADHWHTVTLDDSYDDPVVFAQIASYDGADACHARVRNVQSDSFEVQIEEWNVHNGQHVEEDVGYVVLERGSHTLADGLPLEVQTTTADEDWTEVHFSSEFGNDPAVVSRAQTENGSHEIVTRTRNVDEESFELRLQEEEGRGGEHVDEIVAVAATPRRDVDVGIGCVENVDHDWTEFAFETRWETDPVVLTNLDTFNGRDTADTQLRNVSPTSAEVRVEEEASQNDEMEHAPESVSVLSLPDVRVADENGDRVGLTGTVEFGQSDRGYWHTVKYGERYSDPVVFADVQTYNGGQPSHVRLRNVGPESFEIQIEEWEYLNGKHVEETIGFVVLESGTHVLSDGSHLHVGTTQATHQWFGVDFVPDYQNEQPAVLTQCQTRNGSNPIVTRTANLDAHGFDVRLQEEEQGEQRHNVESVGFVGVARPGRSVPTYETDRVLDAKVEDFSVEDCAFEFENDFPTGQYTLSQPIDLGPFGQIEEIGDTSNGMCGGMVLAARDYFEHGRSPWPAELREESPPNSPVSSDPPAEDTPLFDFLSERLFDSFVPGDGNPLGAGIYQTLMNSANTKQWGQVKKSRNEVMRDEWQNEIKPALDSGTLCPLGLIHVDTHGNPFKTGLNQIGNNHQVLAYGYTRSGDTIEIYVYDPNDPDDDEMRVQFTKKSDLGNWFEPRYIDSDDPLYGFFAVPYSAKSPPESY